MRALIERFLIVLSRTLAIVNISLILACTNNSAIKQQSIPVGDLLQYYVDATGGDDSNDGLSPEKAWKSIAKVNNMQFDGDEVQVVDGEMYQLSKILPGDIVAFKRGEIWQEKLIILSSGNDKFPVIFEAYGEGPAPILSGGACLSLACGTSADWQLATGSIYWLSTQNNIGLITENDIPLTLVPWGSEGLETNLAKMQAGSSLYDHERKIIYLWMSDGSHPDSFSVVAGVVDNVVVPRNSEHFIFRDIEISHAGATCLRPQDIRNAIFDNLVVHSCGGQWNPGGNFYYGNGITLVFNIENVTIKNSKVYNVYDSAISPQSFYRERLLQSDIFILNNELFNAPHSVIEVTNWSNRSVIRNLLIQGNSIHDSGASFSRLHHWNRPLGSPGILITVGDDRASTIENITVRDNEIFDNELEAIAIGRNSGVVRVESNRIIRNGGAGVMVYDDHGISISEAIIEDNTIRNNGAGIIFNENVAVTQENNILQDNGTINIETQIQKYIGR